MLLEDFGILFNLTGSSNENSNSFCCWGCSTSISSTLCSLGIEEKVGVLFVCWLLELPSNKTFPLASSIGISSGRWPFVALVVAKVFISVSASIPSNLVLVYSTNLLAASGRALKANPNLLNNPLSLFNELVNQDNSK